MKKFLKVIGIIFIVFIVIFAGFYIYMLKAFPKIDPAPVMKVEPTPERLEKGKYLVEHVAGCVGCHSERNFGQFSGPLVKGSEGKGGEEFDESLGFPGSFYARNITPAGIGTWTDGELFRAITSGVNKDGEPLFPLMPYLRYGQLDQEDINSIIAYIRTLKPVTNEVPKDKPKFPMNLIMRTIPSAPKFQKRPDKSNPQMYGMYLVTMASCIDCHSKAVKGQITPGMEFAGGFEFPFKNGYVVRSANITPDEETGIGKWTKEMFIAKFKAFDRPTETLPPVKTGDLNTWMPWSELAGMTEEDLGYIFDYLRSLKPVSNKVEKFSQIGVK